MAKTVAILLGSKTDLEHVRATEELLQELGVEHETHVISAHRQPEKLHAYVKNAERAGTRVFITAAGLAAALPGVVASMSNRPVIGIPVPGGALRGVDALLSIVQMPGGIPVATVGIGSNGSKNAAILAAQILALSDPKVAERVSAHREKLREG